MPVLRGNGRRGGPVLGGLGGEHRPVDAVRPGHELLVGAFFGYSALVEDVNAVGVGRGCQAVSHENNRVAFVREGPQALERGNLRVRVERYLGLSSSCPGQDSRYDRGM